MDLRQKYGKVAVIMGGDSSEREVSLLSGEAVLSSLVKSGVDAHKFDFQERSIWELINDKFCRAFLVTHGRGGEDGTLQGVLEYLKIPYTGSGVKASSIAMDKYRTKLIWQALNIPLAKSQYIVNEGFNLAEFQLQLKLPVVVKPSCEGSTLGLTKVYQKKDLAAAINLAFTKDKAILIEELVNGDEFTIIIDGNKIYPLVKIEAPSGNYDYQHKYFTDETRYICPFNLGSLQAKIEKLALLGYQAVGARGVARLDFMLDQSGKIYFLEINTLPGMTSHSLVPLAFNAKGINFDKLCLSILDGATLGD